MRCSAQVLVPVEVRDNSVRPETERAQFVQVKGRRCDYLLKFFQPLDERGDVAHRGAIITIVQVHGPAASRWIGSELQQGSVQIIAGNPWVRSGTRHEEKGVHGIERDHAAMLPMVSGATGDCEPSALGLRAQRNRQRGNVALEYAGVRFKRSGVDFPRNQSLEIAGVKAWTRGE